MIEFEDEMKDFIVEKLNELEGLIVYACDLTSELTRDDNAVGAYIIGYSDALDYISEHISEAADAWNYYNDELNYPINPFEYPELFTYCMLDYGVHEIMGRVKYVSDHWDDQITLDKPTIGIITAQIEEDEDEEAVYYLMQHAYLAESDARYLIEWWSDDPLPWAEKYAPYIDTLSPDDDPDTWEHDNPDDHVIIDADLTCPIVISATPVRY